MTLAEICFLPVSFICGLIRYFSGWNNVSKTADFKPSGLGTGWICVILLVIVAAIVLNENSDRIWQFLRQHGFVILSIALIFITLYLKGNLSGWNIDSKTAALTTNGLGTGLICVILVFVTVLYPLTQQQSTTSAISRWRSWLVLDFSNLLLYVSSCFVSELKRCSFCRYRFVRASVFLVNFCNYDTNWNSLKKKNNWFI